MKNVGIVRDRGQLTIPESIRKQARWSVAGSVVSITLERPDQILISPHVAQKETQWDNLLELIKKARAIKGRGAISTSEFLQKYR